jgi:hypothetical protein
MGIVHPPLRPSRSTSYQWAGGAWAASDIDIDIDIDIDSDPALEVIRAWAAPVGLAAFVAWLRGAAGLVDLAFLYLTSCRRS